MNSKNTRRKFIKKYVGYMAGLGLSFNSFSQSDPLVSTASNEKLLLDGLPENPLILFDNFHAGNRRSYPLKTRLASAVAAGFDGFEFVMLDPGSDAWKESTDLMTSFDFKVWGLHRTTNAVIDSKIQNLGRDIEKIEEVVEASESSPIEYITLSISGGTELRGRNIEESGSAIAEDRHWERSYKLINAFDKACKKHGIRGSLYPHTHWLCDTPQSQQRILDGANASTIGPALCSHHWYANKNSLALDEVFKMPMMEHLNYVVMTNGRFQGNNFPAVRFDLGEIDMAWFLAMIYSAGYKGPISTQGWRIGGDPYVTSKIFVDNIKKLRTRFLEFPELWPI